jgi:hypothetical protein
MYMLILDKTELLTMTSCVWQKHGAVDELKKSYDWGWLATYALLKRNLIPDQ